MKNFLNKFKYFIIGGITVVSGTIYAAALQPSFNPSLIPVETNKYYLGSTSPDRVWAGLFVNQICLSGDCKTAWPVGGGGGGVGTFSTSTVAGNTSLLINYPNNATDVVLIGSTSGTSTAEVFFDPNIQSYRIGSSNIASTTFMGVQFFPTIGQGFHYGGTNGQLNVISTSTLASYLFTPTSYGMSTSTITNFVGGLFSPASSTFSGPFRLPALTQGYTFVGSTGLVGTISSSTLAANMALNCATITGSADLCDGVDDAGSGADQWSPHPHLGASATTSTIAIGTTTMATNINQLSISSSTASQLGLFAGTGIAGWTVRNAGGNIYFSTTTVTGTATSTISALEIDGATGTTTIKGAGLRLFGAPRFLDFYANANNPTVRSGLTFFESSEAAQFGVWYDGSGSLGNNKLVFHDPVNAVDRFTFLRGGAMGIATTAPQWSLSVASTTMPQIGLLGNNTDAIWTLRSIGNSFYLATASPTTFATSSISALTVNSDNIVRFGNNTATCIALTGDAGLCDGGDASSSFSGSPNSIIVSNAAGNAIVATGTQLTVGNILATTTATSTFMGPIISKARQIIVGSGATVPYVSTGGGDPSYFLINRSSQNQDGSLLFYTNGACNWEFGMPGGGDLLMKSCTGTDPATFTTRWFISSTTGAVGYGTEQPTGSMEVATSSPSQRSQLTITNKNTGAGSRGSQLALCSSQGGWCGYFSTDVGFNGNQNFAWNWGAFGTGLFMDSNANFGINNTAVTSGSQLTVTGVVDITGQLKIATTTAWLNSSITAVGTTTVQGQINSLTASTSAASTQTINWSSGNTQSIMLTSATTQIVMNATSSNPVDGGKYVLKICQDGSGSRAINWSNPIGLRWTSGTTTITSTANKCTFIGFIYTAQNGNNIYSGIASSTNVDIR